MTQGQLIYSELEGVRVPSFLYGTSWKEDETRRLTELALRQGYRGTDTAKKAPAPPRGRSWSGRRRVGVGVGGFGGP